MVMLATVQRLISEAGVGGGNVTGAASSTDSDIVLFDGTTGKVIKDSGIQASTDGTFAGNSDSLVPTQKASKTYADTKVTANAGITGGTKTKITYDAKGLVTGGADATTADIADSTNKRYVTDAQLTVIGNTSGTNSGDQDLSGYVLKSTFDANTVLKADSDNTPAALTIGEQTVLGRATGGSIAALSIDSDISSVSASDDTVPSAKATKAYADTKIASSYLDTDGALAANSDTKIASQKATKTYADTKIASSYLDTDGTLTANSDTKIASQKATKTYADTKLAKATNVTAINDTGIADGEIAVFNATSKDIRTSDKVFSTDGTLSGNSDSNIPTEKAVKTYADGLVSGGTRVSGEIVMYGGSSAPSGWHLCNGAAISRTTYSTLFTAIGTTFGTGDGSTTFNVPNMQGKVPVGKDSGTFATLGGTGGEETHTLSAAEMPSHTHTVYSFVSDTGSGTTAIQRADVASTNASYNSGGATNTAGSGSAHNNLQPYLVLNYIIKD